MSLTYVKDKLIAISGIAQRMSGSFKCNYLAGLWEERLLEQLLWEVEGPKPSCRKPYQAPSWSWASINGRIKNVVTCFDISAYHAPCFEMFLVTVLDVRVTTTDATQFGQVTAGYLKIRGRLIPATRSNYGFSAQENNPLYGIMVFFDTEEDSNSSGKLYLLPICRTTQAGGMFEGNESSHKFHCLLLKRIGLGKGEFERIAVMPLSDEDIRVFETAGTEEYGALSEEDVESYSEDPSQPHVFSLV
jgi:hypothetical protein